MVKTALVTGATGFLGRQVSQAFQSAGFQIVGTGFTRANPPAILKINLSNPAEISSALQEVKPDVVVHCAANRFPDKCDANPDEARKINVEASKHLAQATSSKNILLIYISTDYVFPGRPGEAPYEAHATPEPTNLYGQTKLDGERAILQATEGTSFGVVLRVPVLYGKAEDPKESAVNILMDVVWKSQEKDARTKMDDWAKRYPTNIEDVARVCVDTATRYLNGERYRLPKILQFSSEDRFTKYEICQLFAEIMGLSLDGMVADDKAGNDPNASVQRPYDTHLSNQALKDIGIDVGTQDFKAWW
ncbi:hypothetical protein HO133_005493 [Letharia lupina]|uniref:RmlD-like substrate binding domain-containing protein n=1 Tax=Letharia lupina TaxID=560253 RepID=A0A8H6C952_9LECA|nr:uncharacterized protein HO133_005493 [Letharia lupina]KAF6218949.1 hypothetical protein HO133_005493 [Letharia lupina]